MSNTEHDLFLEAMEGVTPLRPQNGCQASTRRTRPSDAQLRRRQAAQGEAEEDGALTLAPIPLLHPYDPVGFKRDGVQEGVYRNLRLGKYPSDARLDLQGRSLAEARDEVPDFLGQSMAFGIRTVTISFGRGPRPTSRGNLFKTYLARWLPQIPEVMAFHSAKPAQGGVGAISVLLFKSEQARLDNREKHQKRRP